MTEWEPLPATAAWAHVEAREGFEVLVVDRTSDGGHVLTGSTSAVEDGHAWTVGYRLVVGPDWRTRSAEATARSAAGERAVRLERSDGGWLVDGRPDPALDDCVDVDLESSLVTNTLPLHRLDLAPGVRRDAPAAYVAADLRVTRLEQAYAAVDDRRVHYESATFAFAATLTLDASGLVVDYPGLGVRRL